MKARRSWFVVALGLSLAGSLPACDGFLSSSKMAQGQRYQADDQRYDPYFDNVHQVQVAAASWPDEKKAARRPLVNALSLTPTASDDTIVSATRDRARKLGGAAKLDLAAAHVSVSGGGGDPTLFAAVEETVRLELERARKLKDKVDKLEELAKQGDGLKESADKEFSNRGAEKADEKKTDKSREVRRELGGAVDAMRSLSRDAAKQSRDAQDFLEDLGSALEAKDTPSRSRSSRGEAKPLPPAPPKAEEKKPEEKKPEAAKPSKPPSSASKPKPAPAEKPASTEKPEKPAPAEKPATKPAPPPDEVFNP